MRQPVIAAILYPVAFLLFTTQLPVVCRLALNGAGSNPAAEYL